MSNFQQLTQSIAQKRGELNQLKADLFANEQALQRINAQLDEINRLTVLDVPVETPAGLANAQVATMAAISAIKTDIADSTSTMNALRMAINGTDPTLLAANLDDELPVVLLPIRVETRFMKVRNKIEMPDTSVVIDPGVISVGGTFKDLTGLLTPYLPGGLPVTTEVLNTAGPLFDNVVTTLAGIPSVNAFEDQRIREGIASVQNVINPIVAGLANQSQGIQTSVNTIDANVASITSKNTTLANSINRVKLLKNPLLNLNLGGLTGNLVTALNGLGTTLQTINTTAFTTTEQVVAAQVSVKAGLDNVNSKISLVTALLSTLQLNSILTANTNVQTLLATFNNLTANFKGTQLAALTNITNTSTILNTGIGRVLTAGTGVTVNINHVVATSYTVTDELWVRFYPDDISVDDLERELTQTESDAGKLYWNSVWSVTGNKIQELGFWRKIVNQFGTTRAAYIVKAMTPTNYILQVQNPSITVLDESVNGFFDEIMMALENAEAAPTIIFTIGGRIVKTVQDFSTAVSGTTTILTPEAEIVRNAAGLLGTITTNIEDAINSGVFNGIVVDVVTLLINPLHIAYQLLDVFINRVYTTSQIDKTVYTVPPVFPGVTIKNSSWTQPAKVNSLPDRFVVRLYKNNALVHEEISAVIPTELTVGLDPSAQTDILTDAKKELVFPEDQNWMYDFKSALEVGMAMRIQLTADQADVNTGGFDQLTVIGVRSETPQSSQQTLETLFESHRFTGQGLHFVPTGTATNNTDKKSSGYSPSELDPVASFNYERKGPQYVITNNPLSKTDGQLLTDSLGLSSNVFQNIQFSKKFDLRDSRAMNIALWQATLGNYLEEMVGGLIHYDDIRKVRDFAINNVSARGNLPTISIGNQPYGFITTTQFSTINFIRPEDKVKTLVTEEELFLNKLQNTLVNELGAQWLAQLSKVKSVHTPFTSTNSDVTSSQARLFDILGLQATSSEFKIRSAAGQGYSGNFKQLLDIFRNALPNSSWSGTEWDELYFELEDLINAASENREEGKKSLIFNSLFMRATQKLTKNLIDEFPLSETNKLENNKSENYINYLFRNKLSVIRQGVLTGQNVSTSLLYSLMEYAQFLQYWDAGMDILAKEGILTPEIETGSGDRKNYRNFRLASEGTGILPPKTKWYFLFSDYLGLRGSQDQDISLADYLESSQIFKYYSSTRYLIEYKRSLSELANLTTAQLERLLTEHLDMVSYRMDAWQLGLANKQLMDSRAITGKQTGLHLGAYGYLENVKPSAKRVDANGIEITYDFDGNNLIESAIQGTNQGFIHAPSLAHAITAAVLRSGYLSEATTAFADRLAIDLSSQRVRKALGLIEGIKNGQTLNALLGYQFERGLRQHNDISLGIQQFIPDFRNLFPYNANTIESTKDTTKVASSIAASNVVDGLALMEAYKNGLPPFENNTVTLSGLTSSVLKNKIVNEVKGLELAIDALSDLILAEGVFQLTKGNQERANAVLESVAAFDRPIQDPEIIQTPLESVTITNRIAANFVAITRTTSGINTQSSAIPYIPNSALAGTISGILQSYDDFNPWVAIPITERAKCELSLNKWIADAIGITNQDLASYRCTVVVRDPADDAIPEVTGFISLMDLKLQPIDLVYTMGDILDISQQDSTFCRLIRFRYLELNPAQRGKQLIVNFDYQGSTTKSFVDLLNIIRPVYTLLQKTRALNAEDLLLSNSNLSGNSIDITDLTVRIFNLASSLINTDHEGAYQRLQRLKTNLIASNLSNPATATDAAIVTAANNLLIAFEFGFSNVIPTLTGQTTEAIAIEIKSQIDGVLTKIDIRLAAIIAGFTNGAVNASLTEKQKATFLIEKLKIAFDNTITIVPLFRLLNANEFRANFQSKGALLPAGKPLFMEEYLTSLSLVRKNTGIFENIRFLAELNTSDFTRTASPLNLSPIQFSNEPLDFWVANEFPANKTVTNNAMSVLMQLPQTMNLNGNTVFAGLLIEDWAEEIPQKDISTGLVVNYDQPNAVAPQSVLVAVSPTITGQWDWHELHEIVRETITLSKMRAVEPDHLIDNTSTFRNIFSQLLPTVITEVVNNRNDTTLFHNS